MQSSKPVTAAAVEEQPIQAELVMPHVTFDTKATYYARQYASRRRSRRFWITAFWIGFACYIAAKLVVIATQR